MELFSIVVINLMFCGIMYAMVSLKVQKSVSEYYDLKLQRAIDQATAGMIKEMDVTITAMDRKLVAIRNLVERFEALKKEMNHYEKQTEVANLGMSFAEETIPNTVEKEMKPSQPLEKQEEDLQAEEKLLRTTEGAATRLFSPLGKAVKGVLGISESNPMAVVPEPEPYTSRTDFTVSGNPFENQLEEPTKKLENRREFQNQLTYALDPSWESFQKQKDKISISVDALLLELPPSATKIDKVVHLLKKGLKNDEISEAMNIGVHEIHLIKTIRLDGNKGRT